MGRHERRRKGDANEARAKKKKKKKRRGRALPFVYSINFAVSVKGERVMSLQELPKHVAMEEYLLIQMYGYQGKKKKIKQFLQLQVFYIFRKIILFQL